jgi:hypothetical protein
MYDQSFMCTDGFWLIFFTFVSGNKSIFPAYINNAVVYKVKRILYVYTVYPPKSSFSCTYTTWRVIFDECFGFSVSKWYLFVKLNTNNIFYIYVYKKFVENLLCSLFQIKQANLIEFRFFFSRICKYWFRLLAEYNGYNQVRFTFQFLFVFTDTEIFHYQNTGIEKCYRYWISLPGSQQHPSPETITSSLSHSKRTTHTMSLPFSFDKPKAGKFSNSEVVILFTNCWLAIEYSWGAKNKLPNRKHSFSAINKFTNSKNPGTTSVKRASPRNDNQINLLLIPFVHNNDLIRMPNDVLTK